VRMEDFRPSTAAPRLEFRKPVATTP
jgi:hypothetical protein